MPLYSPPEPNSTVLSAFTVKTESVVCLKSRHLQESCCCVEYRVELFKFSDIINIVINFATVSFSEMLQNLLMRL